MNEPASKKSLLPQPAEAASPQDPSHRTVSDDSTWATQMLDWYQLDGFPNFAYSNFLVPPDPLIQHPRGQGARVRSKNAIDQPDDPTTTFGDEEAKSL